MAEYFFALAVIIAIGCIPVYAFRQGDVGVFRFALDVIGVILAVIFVVTLVLLVLSWILRSAPCISLGQRFATWCREKEISKRIYEAEERIFLMVAKAAWPMLVLWVNIFEKIVDVAWKVANKVPQLAYVGTIVFFTLGPLSAYRAFGPTGLWLFLGAIAFALFWLVVALLKKAIEEEGEEDSWKEV